MGLTRVLWRWAPPALYLGLVYAVSLTPKVPATGIYGVDKVLHLLEFGVLGLLLYRAGGPSPKLRMWMTLAVIGLCCGVLDELIQRGVPGRHSSIWDFMADAIGFIAGMSWGCRFWKYRFVRKLA